MELLNTFFILNVAGCAAALIAFASMSERVRGVAAKANFAGASGMAVGLGTVGVVAQMFV